jgi:uncharacterized protein (DUF2237 family)
MSQFTLLKVCAGAGCQALGVEVACAVVTQVFKVFSAKRPAWVA